MSWYGLRSVNIFDEIDTSCEKQLVNSLSDPKQLYAIFTLDDPKKLRMEVERIFLRMRSVLEKKMDIYMTTGVSRPCSQYITKTATEARTALKQRIIYGNAIFTFMRISGSSGNRNFRYLNCICWNNIWSTMRSLR